MYRWFILLVLLCGCAASPVRVVDDLVYAKLYGDIVDTSGGWPETDIPLKVYDLMGSLGYDLTSEPEQQVWIKERFGPLDMTGKELVFCQDGLNQESTGIVMTGVYDYAADKWRWQEMTGEGKTWWNPEREWCLGFDMVNVEQPVSEDGYVYFMIVSYGGSTAVHRVPTLRWANVAE